MYYCGFDGNGFDGSGIDGLYWKRMFFVRTYGTDKPKNYFNRGSGSVWNSSWIDDPWDRISVIFSK